MRSEDQGIASWRALSRTQDFQTVYEAGVKHVGRLFVLYLYPGDGFARAVVASRKVGNAVCRNRAKRLLRETLRRRIESVPGRIEEIRAQAWFDDSRWYTEDGVSLKATSKGLWLVAVARRRILDAHCGEVIAEMDRILQRPSSDRPAIHEK